MVVLKELEVQKLSVKCQFNNRHQTTILLTMSKGLNIMIAFAYAILKICYEKLHTNKTVSSYYYSNVNFL